jgi:hypothetical protein
MADVNPYDFKSPGGQFQRLVGSALSGGTIAPTKMIHHINNTTAISTITPPHEGFSGPIYLVADSQFTAVATGNIALGITTTVAKKVYCLIYDPATANWYPINP